jgi:hypothetical protein
LITVSQVQNFDDALFIVRVKNLFRIQNFPLQFCTEDLKSAIYLDSAEKGWFQIEGKDTAD